MIRFTVSCSRVYERYGTPYKRDCFSVRRAATAAKIALCGRRRASAAHARARLRSDRAAFAFGPSRLTLPPLWRSPFRPKGLLLIQATGLEMMVEKRGGKDDGEQNSAAASPYDTDLAALARSPFIIGDKLLHEIKPPNARPMWVRFEEDGLVYNRAYRTNAMWKARVTFALREGRSIRALEFDEWGRLNQLFPIEVRARLGWNTAQPGELAPVARLYDADGDAEMLLLRSCCDGHAVVVIHNLSEGGPVRQSVWVADIMRLSPLLRMKLVRDEAFVG
jgi:hypothetical protein